MKLASKSDTLHKVIALLTDSPNSRNHFLDHFLCIETIDMSNVLGSQASAKIVFLKLKKQSGDVAEK